MAAGGGHSQPGLVTALQPWRPKQPPGGRAVGETSPPPTLLCPEHRLFSGGAKASPYYPKPGVRAPCRTGPPEQGQPP